MYFVVLFVCYYWSFIPGGFLVSLFQLDWALVCDTLVFFECFSFVSNILDFLIYFVIPIDVILLLFNSHFVSIWFEDVLTTSFLKFTNPKSHINTVQSWWKKNPLFSTDIHVAPTITAFARLMVRRK